MTHPRQKSLVSVALAIAVVAAASLAPQPAEADNSLVVRDFVLTRDIAGREPIDNIRTYGPADGDAIAFARLDNSGGPTTVTFRWYFGGQEHAEVQMPVGNSPGWRTWSSANLRPGSWRVELVDANGIVLTEARFWVGRTDVARGSLEPNRTDRMSPVKPSGNRTGRNDLYDFPFR